MNAEITQIDHDVVFLGRLGACCCDEWGEI